jgi:hypothetical protein
MNFIARLLRNSRFKYFAAATENRVFLLRASDCAAALVQAVEYCLDLRHRDGGTLISMALLNPDQLAVEECKKLFHQLETPYFQAGSIKISKLEVLAVSQRHGKRAGEEYKKVTEELFHLHAIGLGILMARLSFRAANLTAKTSSLSEYPSAYTRISSYLIESRPHIDAAVNQRNSLAEMTTPEKVWSPETVSFAKNSANILAMSFPS